MMLFPIKISAGVLPGNHHGRPDYTTLTRTARIYRMESYSKQWRLYLYGKTGRAYWINVDFPHWIGGWPV
jgi:hypothetical protein